MQHCMRRRISIRYEMGFMDPVASSGVNNVGSYTSWRGLACTGWALKRQEAWSAYENDFSFRTMAGNSKRFGTIFQHFNESVNVPKRAVNVYKARAAEALVNTSPFTGFMPEGQDDDSDAIKLAERLFHRKLDDAEARFHFREAIQQACLSEAVMKTTLHPVPGETQIRNSQIWMDALGEPLRDSANGFVYGDEPLDASPDVLGARCLRRDPSVLIGNAATLSDPTPVPRTDSTTYKLDTRPVGWENFFCSILEPDIHSADCCFHEFDEDLDVLMTRIQGARLSQPAKQWLETVKQSCLRYPQSEGSQPVWRRGERDPELYGPIKVHICEQWIRYDVYENNNPIELCVTWAVSSGGTEAWPIYYDLMKTASPTGKRPFEVVRIIPVKDRWYGFGFYDLLSNEHAFIDDAWSRIRARSSASGRFDWMKRGSWEGLDYGTPATLSTGRVYVMKQGTDGPVSEHMGSVAFAEMDEKIWEMLKMAMQSAQLISGTMTAGDSMMSGLPANNTATGQDLLANESELASNDTTQDVIRGIVATLKQCIVAVFENCSNEELNLLLGANDGKKLIDWLATNKPKDFATHVKLLLTKARSKQALQAASQANQIITGGLSWLQIILQYPQFADHLKPFFMDMLNSLDISNATKVLEIPPELMAQAVAQQQMQMQSPTQMPAKQTQSTAIPRT